jgi:molybdenum cofactor guanylyltransferase
MSARTSSTSLPAYILAGGRSSRFGSDKALALVKGQPLLLHVADMLRPVARETTIVAERAGKYAHLGLPTVADLEPGRGPIGGLATALTHLPHADSWLLLCCCDALIIRSSWLHALIAASEVPCDAVAFKGDFWQPMPAIYHRKALSTVLAHLQSGRNSMNHLLNHLQTRALPQPQDWPSHWQANSKADLASFSASAAQ